MGLATRAGHFSGHEDVLRVAEHPGEGVAGQGLGGRVQLRHDHPRIQTAGERDPDLFAPCEVPRQVAREDLAHLPVVDFRLEQGLALPLVGLEVRRFPLGCAVTQDPLGRAGEYGDPVEQGPIFQHAPA